MASGITWNQADSDDELESTSDYLNAGKTASLMVIDTSPAMFQPWAENEDTPFRAALKCCQAMWRSKVISNPKDQVAILLSSTEHANNESGFPNLFMLQDMSEVNIRMIEDLNKITTDEELDGFDDAIGSSSKCNMKELFWLAKIIYEDAKVKSFGKKLTYFTCEDNPHSGHSGLRQDAIKNFKDLKNLDFNIVTFREDFDYTKFYNNLIDDQSCITFPSNLSSLMKIVRMRQRVKRTTLRTTMQVTPGIKIGIGIYSLVRRASPPKAVKINKRNDEPLTRDVRTFRAASGMTVLKSEQVKMVDIGGARAVFKPEELKELKEKRETGVQVIGFLNRDEFDPFTSFRTDSYFIYPDEDRVTGSTDFFTTLLRRSHALQKVILAKITMSRSRTPKLGCLIPSMGETNAAGSKDPTGFYVFMIPFSDEMRGVKGESELEAPASCVELMEKVIRKTMNRSFDLQSVQSPMLQSVWRQIEMKAFNQDAAGGCVLDTDEEFYDFTEPNEAAMEERIGGLCDQLNQEVANIAGAFDQSYSTNAPRQRGSSAQNPTPKPVDMANEARHNRLEKCTCDMLTSFLTSKGIEYPFRARKATLVTLVYEYFQTHDN